MTEEEQDALVERIAARTPGNWDGLTVGPGWYAIVDETDKALAALDPDYTVHQIKEKFAGLRYYMGSNVISYDQQEEIIGKAEAQAAVTCETCGEPGTRRDAGWVRTVCDQHSTEQDERRRVVSEGDPDD